MSPRRLALLPLVLITSLFAAEPSVSWVPEGLPPFPTGGRGIGAFIKPEQGKALLDAALVRFPDRDSWDAYARHVRQRMQEAAQLSPWPKRSPLNAVIHSRREHDGYSVENVYFESAPGNYVTGNLYRPLNAKPPYAAIISPHGHTGGVTKPEDYARQGRFEPGMQSRCATLARMGAVVFSIDMFGCDDSIQLVGSAAHRQPLVFTIQTWNSMRTVDFLISLDGVDPNRIGISGYSGGGTQTFMLAALDPRVAVSVPVAMVSEYHFGGCPCESGQPVHHSDDHFVSNPMVAALFAPKPMLVISDGGDWTTNTPKDEFPFIQKIYAYYGATQNVANVHRLNEGHDYGPTKRDAAYHFFAGQFALDVSKIDETHVAIEPPAVMHVFNADHPIPATALHDAQAIAAALKKLQE
jgi:hypothetical protein